MIILLLLISFCISFYYTFTVPPVYASSSSLIVKEIEDKSSFLNIVGGNKIIEIENEKLLLKSRVVAEKVIKELWASEKKDNLFLFNNRKFIPRGQEKRNLLKKIFI